MLLIYNGAYIESTRPTELVWTYWSRMNLLKSYKPTELVSTYWTRTNLLNSLHPQVRVAYALPYLLILLDPKLQSAKTEYLTSSYIFECN